MSVRCPSCGTSLPDGALFCGACGSSLEQPVAPQPAPAVTAAPAVTVASAPAPAEPVRARPRRRWRLWLGILLGSVVLSGAAVAVGVRWFEARTFGNDHAAILDAVLSSNEQLFAALRSEPDPQTIHARADEAASAVGDVERLDSERFAAEVLRLDEALDGYELFLSTLSALVGGETAASERTRANLLLDWEDATRALGAALEDAPQVEQPDWSSLTATLERASEQIVEAMVRRQARDALTGLTIYHSDIAAIVKRYWDLRQDLIDENIGARVLDTDQAEDAFRALVTGHAADRYDVADELDAIVPPSSLATLHRRIAITIRALADGVAALEGAADEAACYYSCEPVRSTQAYQDYVAAGTRLVEQLDRILASWESAYRAEDGRLRDAA